MASASRSVHYGSGSALQLYRASLYLFYCHALDLQRYFLGRFYTLAKCSVCRRFIYVR